MGMDKAMIDWTKPIETVDGCNARVIQTNATEPKIWHMVHVLGGPGRYGDVFIVNNEGYLCDDRTMGRKYSQEPFIRNVRVKREGWVLVEPYSERMLAIRHIYETEEEALKAKDYYGTTAGTKAVFFQWEE
jgi:hypothetical protein